MNAEAFDLDLEMLYLHDQRETFVASISRDAGGVCIDGLR